MQSYYRYGETINPDVWFEPTEVIVFIFHICLASKLCNPFLGCISFWISLLLLLILKFVKGSSSVYVLLWCIMCECYIHILTLVKKLLLMEFFVCSFLMNLSLGFNFWMEPERDGLHFKVNMPCRLFLDLSF